MIKTAWLLLFVVAFSASLAQSKDHISWRFSSVEQSGSEWKLVFTATLDQGWHLYSQSTDEGGPMPTLFSFDPASAYRLIGRTMEFGELKKVYDPTFMVDVLWYEGQVTFNQKVKAKGKVIVTGKVEYSVCSEEVCVPGIKKFSIYIGK